MWEMNMEKHLFITFVLVQGTKEYLLLCVMSNLFLYSVFLTLIFILRCVQVASILIQAGATPEKLDKYSISPFIIAAANGHVDMTQFLAQQKKVNINRSSKIGWSGLFLFFFFLAFSFSYPEREQM